MFLPWHRSVGTVRPVSPKFSEMSKVLVRYESGPLEGYVISIQEQDGGWIYEICHRDYDNPDESWDNWASEEMLEEVK